MNFKRTWFDCSENVLFNHENIEVRQRYLYMITKDNHIIIVSKDGTKWQFPGGHPEGNETWRETLIREIWEESGVKIENLLEKIQKFGYYLIEEDGIKYLQERYILFLDKSSNELDLIPHEREDDHTEIIKFVKDVPVSDLPKFIPWITEVEDWKKAEEFLD